MPKPRRTTARRSTGTWRRWDPDDLRVAASRVNLGLTVLQRQRPAEARELAEQAISLLERTSADHPYLGHALVLLAAAAERGGDGAAAETTADRVLSLCESGLVLEPLVCTEARWVLARVLVTRPAGRARGLELGRRVQQELRAAPDAARALVREVDEWLRAIEAGASLAAPP